MMHRKQTFHTHTISFQLNYFMKLHYAGVVAYFCHYSSDNYVDLKDFYVDLSVIYVDFSDHYANLSEKNHHNL